MKIMIVLLLIIFSILNPGSEGEEKEIIGLEIPLLEEEEQPFDSSEYVRDYDTLYADEVVSHIRGEYIKNYPNETAFCLKGKVKGLFFKTLIIYGYSEIDITRVTPTSAEYSCPGETKDTIKSHTHTDIPYHINSSYCSPSEQDIKCGKCNKYEVVFCGDDEGITEDIVYLTKKNGI